MALKNYPNSKLAKEVALKDMQDAGLSLHTALEWEKEMGISFSMIELRKNLRKVEKNSLYLFV